MARLEFFCSISLPSDDIYLSVCLDAGGVDELLGGVVLAYWTVARRRLFCFRLDTGDLQHT
jgi:hypothetical protein